MGLIEKDYRIFDFIENFIAKHGYAPCVREIMDGTCLSGPAVEPGLRKLRRAGFIDFQDGKPRTIVIQRYNLTEKGRRELEVNTR